MGITVYIAVWAICGLGSILTIICSSDKKGAIISLSFGLSSVSSSLIMQISYESKLFALPNYVGCVFIIVGFAKLCLSLAGEDD